MKCQKCGNKTADTHIKKVVNGEFVEYNLCSDCAKELGYSNMFESFAEEFAGGFGTMLGSIFANALPARSQATRCEVCGTGYADIARTGMMGCANCYSIFADQLMPTIRRVHGNTTHCGKHSVFAKKEKTFEQEKPVENPVDELKAQLKIAIENQEFEKAAELRDKIKEMEG
jgi:protein arginine kinase activator